jgi:hypothetical protein
VKGELTTTCDTEIILRLWERGGMADVEANTAGYYAIMVLDSEGLLHVAKDDRAPLVIAYSSTIETYLMATNEDILESIAKRMNWHHEPCEIVKNNVYIVFKGNEIQSFRAIEPIGFVSNIDSWQVGKAFGEYDHEDETYEGYRNKDYYTTSDDVPVEGSEVDDEDADDENRAEWDKSVAKLVQGHMARNKRHWTNKTPK